MRLRSAALFAAGVALIVFAVATADAEVAPYPRSPTVQLSDLVPITTTAEFVAEQEGIRLEPYLDVAGHPTICVGHRVKSLDVASKTRAECMDLLAHDLERFRAGVTFALLTWLEPHQVTALVSLCYNIGLSACTDSELFKLIDAGAAEHLVVLEWLSWVHAHVDGQRTVVQGLLERRRREVALFYGD